MVSNANLWFLVVSYLYQGESPILQIGRKVLGKVLELPLLEEVTGPPILVFFIPILNAFKAENMLNALLNAFNADNIHR